MHNENKLNEISVTAAELSKLFGVSIRTIQRLSQEDIISESVGKKGGCKLYNLEDSVQSYCEHLREKAKKKKDDNIQNEQLKSQKLRVDIKLKESQAELHTLKTAITTGKYISVEDVKLDFQRFFAVFKKFAMAIPSRIGSIIAGYVEPVVARGIEKDIKNEIDSMLRTFIVAGHAPEEK